MSKIYLSGPMTGLPDLNFPAFNAESARLRGLGFDVVNPAELNPDGASWGECMRKDIVALMGCGMVATLPGWEHSKSARLEVLIGERLEMAVVKAQDLVHPPAILSAGHAPALGREIDMPRLDSLADIPYANQTPDDWDPDYRKIWQELQVASRNKTQLGGFIRELRERLAEALSEVDILRRESPSAQSVDETDLEAAVRVLKYVNCPELAQAVGRASAALSAPEQEDRGYPPCDYCGTAPDYHPWHGSGLLNGVVNKHIHACGACLSKLPAHGVTVQSEQELPDGLSWDQAPANAVALIGGKIDDLHPERKLFVWVPELDQQTMGVLAAPFDSRPTGSPQSAALDSPNSQWVVLAKRPAVQLNAQSASTHQK
ncbi:DUF4406 domain-containing protein [Pseudomonas sp. Irchel 3A18]|uniref:DUF4406 domain-containing protein n=1 Tax=Pseudomonas sp. Irchel 3A18 TaxID=2008905 RepID=UPI000BA3C0A3|nr:DUF4406 domain-containing protein [Pseudomonas sp. Irchel 3A18]